MGKSSGVGVALILLLALAFSKPKKLTSSDFSGAFQSPSRSFSYTQYLEYVTKPREELGDREALEESITTSGQRGEWLTVGGRIPTPQGTTIPLPTIHVGRTAVETMLKPLEEAKETPQFVDTNGRKSVNLRLTRI